MVTDVADRASPHAALLAQDPFKSLPVLSSGRAVMSFPIPSDHKH